MELIVMIYTLCLAALCFTVFTFLLSRLKKEEAKDREKALRDFATMRYAKKMFESIWKTKNIAKGIPCDKAADMCEAAKGTLSVYGDDARLNFSYKYEPPASKNWPGPKCIIIQIALDKEMRTGEVVTATANFDFLSPKVSDVDPSMAGLKEYVESEVERMHAKDGKR